MMRYLEDNGLYSDLIVLMDSTVGVAEFAQKAIHRPFLKFAREDGATVELTDSTESGGKFVLPLAPDVVESVVDACNRVLSVDVPAHDYVDLPGGYTLMISKDEQARPD